MGDPPKSPTPNFYGILGLPKTASLADIGKAYKSLVMKWHPDRNPSNKAEAEAKFRSINEAYRALSMKKREEANESNGDHEIKTPKKNSPKKNSPKKNSPKKNKSDKNDEEEELQISHPTLLSRTTSRISPMSPHLSRKTTIPSPMEFHTSFASASTGGGTPPTPGTPTDHTFLSKAASRRSSTPIFFSQSAVRKKPEPIEKKLACTLEELCQGCVKKIKITRNVITNTGFILQEEEILMIKVKPGWKKGTKITFEGKGDEKPGTLPADITFVIDEKQHPVFERVGDDLELGVEVPLVQALTGCTIPIPLLGGGELNLSIDDIIYPGYEKMVPGQGMPKPKERGKRGDLRLKFLVDFPHELSVEQRSEVVSILGECS